MKDRRATVRSLLLAQYFEIDPAHPAPRLIARAGGHRPRGRRDRLPDRFLLRARRAPRRQGRDDCGSAASAASTSAITSHSCAVTSRELGAYARVDNARYRLLKTLTPGSYTFILEATRELPRRLLHPRRKTIGLRVPDHPVAQRAARRARRTAALDDARAARRRAAADRRARDPPAPRARRRSGARRRLLRHRADNGRRLDRTRRRRSCAKARARSPRCAAERACRGSGRASLLKSIADPTDKRWISPHLVQTISIYALPVIFGITLHEAAHGYVAKHFGDTTAYVLGRVSLNPVRHIDLVGTIIVPLVILLVTSWGAGQRHALRLGEAGTGQLPRAPQPQARHDVGRRRRARRQPVMALGWALSAKLALSPAAELLHRPDVPDQPGGCRSQRHPDAAQPDPAAAARRRPHRRRPAARACMPSSTPASSPGASRSCSR